MKSGGLIPWNAISAKCSRPLGGWETPYERRFGEPFKGPVMPSGAMVENHPFSAKDQSRLHQFGKVVPGKFLGYALIAGWNLGRWHVGCRLWGVGKLGRVTNPRSKAQCKGNHDVWKGVQKFFIFPMAQQNCLEEIMKFENQLWGGINL